MPDDYEGDTHQCIRCDDEFSGFRPGTDAEGIILYYNQERGTLPLCNECFEEVKSRDVY